MQRVTGLERRQLLIQIARPDQIARLNAGMRQQFDHFADVRRLASFVKQIEQLLERGRIVPHMPDHGVQIFENFPRVLCQ